MKRVVVLERLCLQGRLPHSLCTDNGHEKGMEHSHLGKPMYNGFLKSFNGKLRDECLNENVFESLAEPRCILENLAEPRCILEKRRQDYDIKRPHNALAWQNP